MNKTLFVAVMVLFAVSIAMAGSQGEAMAKSDPALFTDYSSWTKVNDSPITEDITGKTRKGP